MRLAAALLRRASPILRGGEKVFGGQGTFVVEYGPSIKVNGRPWRFDGFATPPGSDTPMPDAPVVIIDPDAKPRIEIWFSTASKGVADGYLHVTGVRERKFCVDAWRLTGKYRPKQRRP